MELSATTYRACARVAGFAFLFYITSGIISMQIGDQSGLADVLSMLLSFSALVLGVTLFALTAHQGPVLALMALTCRVAEGIQYGESSIYFSVGSLLFSWLLLKGKMIPAWLALLGVISSALLVVILPLQLAGLFGAGMSWASPATWGIWLPMLVFEVTLAVYMIVKGVRIEQVAQRAAGST